MGFRATLNVRKFKVARRLQKFADHRVLLRDITNVERIELGFNGRILDLWRSDTLDSTMDVTLRKLKTRGGWGNTPLYGLYRYVRPQRVGFFSRFGLK